MWSTPMPAEAEAELMRGVLHCAHSNGYNAPVAVRVLHDGDVQWGRGMDDIFRAGDAAAWPHYFWSAQHDVKIQAVA